MVRYAKEKRPILTITLLSESCYRKGSRMITIGRIPRKTQAFFKGLSGQFSGRAFGHFWGLVLAMTIGHGSTLDHLARLQLKS